MSNNEDPLDLFEDDEDGGIETVIFFDEDKQSQDSRTPRTGGCCIAFMFIRSTVAGIGCGLIKLMA